MESNFLTGENESKRCGTEETESQENTVQQFEIGLTRGKTYKGKDGVANTRTAQ